MNVSNNQRCSVVTESVHRVIKNLQLEDFHIDIDDSSATANGFLGVISFVEVKHKKGALHLAVKLTNDEQRDFVNLNQMFAREVLFYEKVFPALDEFQKGRGVEKPFTSVAKCYLASSKNGCEALVMENLKSKGFQLLNRLVPMDENHVAFVLREYGRLHALSFALKDQKPEKYREIAEEMDDCFKGFLQSTKAIGHYEARFRILADLLRKQGRDDVARKVDKFVGKLGDFLMNYSDPNHPQSVVVHGDCWTNNMMFKYEGNRSEPSELRLLDFQISKVASPITDFSYYFYTCAPKIFMDDVDKFLGIYYESLSSFMKELGSDPEKLFPLSALKEHWRKYSYFGLVMSVVLFKFMFFDSDELYSITEASFGKIFTNAIKREELCNQRAIDVIVHFAEHDLI